MQWDDHALKLLENFQNCNSYIKAFMSDLSKTLGEEAVKQIKPFTKATALWDGATRGTGALESSLNFQVDNKDGGFTVNFFGLDYGNYVDIGNGPIGSYIYPKGRALAVYKRLGDPIFFGAVRTMGSKGGWEATNFSEKTASWLAEHIHDLADSHIEDLLMKMVNV